MPPRRLTVWDLRGGWAMSAWQQAPFPFPCPSCLTNVARSCSARLPGWLFTIPRKGAGREREPPCHTLLPDPSQKAVGRPLTAGGAPFPTNLSSKLGEKLPEQPLAAAVKRLVWGERKSPFLGGRPPTACWLGFGEGRPGLCGRTGGLSSLNNGKLPGQLFTVLGTRARGKGSPPAMRASLPQLSGWPLRRGPGQVHEPEELLLSPTPCLWLSSFWLQQSKGRERKGATLLLTSFSSSASATVLKLGDSNIQDAAEL